MCRPDVITNYTCEEELSDGRICKRTWTVGDGIERCLAWYTHQCESPVLITLPMLHFARTCELCKHNKRARTQVKWAPYPMPPSRYPRR